MNPKKLLMLSLLASGAMLYAGNDIDLPINGKFYSGSTGAATAPGWIPDNAVGTYRLIPKNEWKNTQEITAEKSPKGILSDFFPISGNLLKTEVKYSGSGKAQICVLFFNAQKGKLGLNSAMLDLKPVELKKKDSWKLPEGTAFVRIALFARENSRALFYDVEAEYIPAPVSPASGKGIVLKNDQKIFLRDIPDQAFYCGGSRVGEEFEFKFGEDSSKNLFWRVVSCDPAQCRVKIDHEHYGVGTLKFDEAEIEIKPLVRGRIAVKLQCGAKNVVVELDVQ